MDILIGVVIAVVAFLVAAALRRLTAAAHQRRLWREAERQWLCTHCGTAVQTAWSGADPRFPTARRGAMPHGGPNHICVFAMTARGGDAGRNTELRGVLDDLSERCATASKQLGVGGNPAGLALDLATALASSAQRATAIAERTSGE